MMPFPEFVRTYGKKLAEWSVVFALGLWFGLNYAGKQAYQSQPRLDGVLGNATQADTEWVYTVQGMAELSILLMAVSAGGWILLDYMGDDDD